MSKVKEKQRFGRYLAVVQKIHDETGRSAWDKGVTQYAIELVDELFEAIDGGWFSEEDLASPKLLEKQLLNGAPNWYEYSWGGCSLIYDQDIAERLCTPSELKRTKNGQRKPNREEEWLDTQARALRQASLRVRIAIEDVYN